MAHPHLLYIGDVPIRPDRSGGSVVLWRHQQLLHSAALTEAPSWLGYRPGLGAWITRSLRRCRLGRLVLILQPWLRRLDGHLPEATRTLLRREAEAILTVGHGLRWVDALIAARSCNLPLITIVHDWYPDASGCPRWGVGLWDRAFRGLVARSDLVLVVSEGMADQLRPHPNLLVLPPMPDPGLQVSPPRKPHPGPWRIYYSGYCGGLYRPLLQALIEAVASDSRFELHVSGSEQQGLTFPEAGGRIRCSGFLEGYEWQQAFDEADALLVLLSFDRRHHRHLATHFPSKLVEYANRGRPIVIWGPPLSSAVKWGQGQPQVLCFSSGTASDLLHTSNRWLAEQPPTKAITTGFQAQQIAEQFNQAVKQLLKPSGSTPA
ncbi:hypothetical protein KBY66_11130 [Synechococcus sp. Tobar12-5m-g]|uniref:glycosyltransferase n=1 Tax=unclassified Synechococcus TaxID=2626047 RepID=UPI0020CEC9DB|nr:MULTISPECIES: glycosyltransferase [unclassified Synechococcus]MCP9773175.1 hypothetical protein [Synechococcus sp. Tobar12-5m-g]MCP9874081.1 hypothetical protein [Synechococcus sp. Cruz CV-v-12]